MYIHLHTYTSIYISLFMYTLFISLAGLAKRLMSANFKNQYIYMYTYMNILYESICKYIYILAEEVDDRKFAAIYSKSFGATIIVQRDPLCVCTFFFSSSSNKTSQ